MDYKKLDEYYKRADIVISPRIYGNEIPMKIYDYLNNGKCILASDAPLHRAILNEEIAILVNANPHDFAKTILLIKENRKEVINLGNKAKAYFEENFSLARMKNKYNILIKSIFQNSITF